MVGEFETGSIGHTLLVGGEYINTSSRQDRFNARWSDSDDDVEFFTVMRPLNFRNGVGVTNLGAPTTNTGFLNPANLNDDTDVDLDVYSVYVQDQIEVTEWLQLVAGLRFDIFDIEVNNIPAAEIRTRKDDELSPRGGIILKTH